MDAVILCPRCTQMLPERASFCRRCGMATMRRPIPYMPPTTPPVRVRDQSGGRGAVWVGGIVFFSLVAAGIGLNLTHTSAPMIQPAAPVIVSPPGVTVAGGSGNPTWTPPMSPGTGVWINGVWHPTTPAAQPPVYIPQPPTAYHSQPPVGYRSVPETAYSHPLHR